jgi:hypothetical protein
MIQHSPLIEALKNPSFYGHPVEKIELIETHISWVLLTGRFAYKIKKPVNLGFVDFSTLEKRRFYCQEELRLNRRLAPALYLGLMTITGPTCGSLARNDLSATDPKTGQERQPEFNGVGPPIEYAVMMKQFDRSQELDRVLERGELRREQLDPLAIELAEFHRQTEIAREEMPAGTLERIAWPMRDNFTLIDGFEKDPEILEEIKKLRFWTEETLLASRKMLLKRKEAGFVRECHGDLHLANMVLIEGRVVVFDCLEFNEELRFIDVISDLAFLLMDLDDRGHSPFANRFLNLYLEASGDYTGLQVLRLYKVYRAMVRAKVASIRLSQMGLDPNEQKRLRQEYQAYIHLAGEYIRTSPGFLLVTHGLSGAGKSVLTQQIAEQTGAIRIRTDVERKRLAGVPGSKRTSLDLEKGLYAPDITRRTYEKLKIMAGELLKADYSVILDGTFLRHEQRKIMEEAAREAGVPFVILEVTGSEPVLRQRISDRIRKGEDASEASIDVLNWQIRSAEPPGEEERPFTLSVNTDDPVDVQKIVKDLKQLGGV